MAILVPVNGALEDAWSWNRFVVPRLRASGHTVFATTLIGLGDRTDLAHPALIWKPMCKTSSTSCTAKTCRT